MVPVILAALWMVSAQAPIAPAQLFPETDTITRAQSLDDFQREWYSRHLLALGESILPEGRGETYRFLWLRSFHRPIVVRVVCLEKACEIVARRSDGEGGYEPGTVVERKARKLSDGDVARVRDLLARAQFWRPQPKDSRIGLDGAQWVLEGRRGRDYHLWDVWSPEAAGPFAQFRELCLQLVRLSGVAVRQNEIY